MAKGTATAPPYTNNIPPSPLHTHSPPSPPPPHTYPPLPSPPPLHTHIHTHTHTYTHTRVPQAVCTHTHTHTHSPPPPPPPPPPAPPLPTFAYSNALSVSPVSPDWLTNTHTSSRKIGQRRSRKSEASSRTTGTWGGGAMKCVCVCPRVCACPIYGQPGPLHANDGQRFSRQVGRQAGRQADRQAGKGEMKASLKPIPTRDRTAPHPAQALPASSTPSAPHLNHLLYTLCPAPHPSPPLIAVWRGRHGRRYRTQ